MLRALAVLIATVLFNPVFSAAAQQEADNQGTPAVFSVSALVYEDGQLLGTPTLTLREGAPGVVAVAGAEGFALEVSVSPASAARLAQYGLTSGQYLDAKTRLFLPDVVADQWIIVAAPEFLLRPGQQARSEIDVFGRGYQRPQARTFSDTVTIELIVVEVDDA